MTNNINFTNGNLLTTDSEGRIRVNQSEGIDWSRFSQDNKFNITGNYTGMSILGADENVNITIEANLQGIDWNKLLNDTFKITNEGKVFLSDNSTLIQSNGNAEAFKHDKSDYQLTGNTFPRFGCMIDENGFLKVTDSNYLGITSNVFTVDSEGRIQVSKEVE